MDIPRMKLISTPFSLPCRSRKSSVARRKWETFAIVKALQSKRGGKSVGAAEGGGGPPRNTTDDARPPTETSNSPPSPLGLRSRNRVIRPSPSLVFGAEAEAEAAVVEKASLQEKGGRIQPPPEPDGRRRKQEQTAKEGEVGRKGGSSQLAR